jgi:hypothetical protein
MQAMFTFKAFIYIALQEWQGDVKEFSSFLLSSSVTTISLFKSEEDQFYCI